MDIIKKIIYPLGKTQKNKEGKIWIDFFSHIESVGDVRVKEDHFDCFVGYPCHRIEGFQIDATLPGMINIYNNLNIVIILIH